MLPRSTVTTLLLLLASPAVVADKPGAPVVIGQVQSYAWPAATGATSRHRDGAWRRTHLVLSPGAGFIKLRLVDFDLRAGETLSISQPGGRVVETLSARGPKRLGTFWTLSVPGDGAHLELRSSERYDDWPFSIDALVVGDAAFAQPKQGASRSLCGAPDFDDVACYASDPEKWAATQATAGVMVVDADASSAVFCTGVSVAPEGHVLSNNHCIANQAQCDNLEYVFGLQRPGCNDGSVPLPDWVGFRCGDVLASQPLDDCVAAPGALDFTLTSVIGNPTETYGYVQPDVTPLADGEPVYIVQHPDGRPKEITHGDDVYVGAHTLAYGGTLDTEPGSSGAPIFRQSDNALVGLHHCGGCETAAQYNRGMAMTAIAPVIEPWLCSASLALVARAPVTAGETGVGGDAVADPGEQWSVWPRVLNRSCTIGATAVNAAFAINAATTALVTLLDTGASFGSIAAGESRSAETPLRFAVDPLTECGSRIVIDSVAIDASNGSFADAYTLLDIRVGAETYETLLSESFDAGLAPGWTVADSGTGGGPAATWTDSNPGGRVLYLSAPFLIADSSALGPGAVMDEQLITPVRDASATVSLALRFSHEFSWFPGGGDEQADVDVRSSATAGSWLNVANFSGRNASGLVEIDLSAWAGEDLQVRFRYYNARYDDWWAIDDVELRAGTGFDCTAEIDQDADGIVDGLDNCSVSVNPAQFDTDGDSIGNACDPDIAPAVNDCQVDFADVAALRNALFSAPGALNWNADADFNGDSRVNFADLAVMRQYLFAVPGPSGISSHCAGR